jgi:hypothetical protein
VDQETPEAEELEDWQAGDGGASEQDWVSETTLTPKSKSIPAELEMPR